MKSLYSLNLRNLLVVAGVSCQFSLFAQTFFHPTLGLQSTYVGACEVNTCTGTSVDDGGGGNYALNITNTYRTFCPSSAGNCVRLTFNSFNLEPSGFFGCYDQLIIGDGPTQNSPAIWQGCGSTLPPVITANNSSGCLTMRFVSDNTVTAPGWSATISCVACGGGPSAGLNNDCSNAQYVCDNLQAITANSQGPGLVSDACVSGCALTENYSNWYILNVTQAGTLDLTIDPTPNTVDYDFSLYGPAGSCGSMGSPIRCSYAANVGNTGMRAASPDQSEDVNGDGWVSTANVVVGTYYLMVNQWSYATNSQFQMDFGGTAVIGLPTPTATSNSPVCANQTLQLNTPTRTGATYSWTGPGGWTSSQQNPTRNPAVAGTYSVTYSINGCTSPAASVIVVVNPVPIASISPATAAVCNGVAATLTASGGGTYAWSNSANTASITVSPGSTTTYTVTVTGANTCTATASRIVTVSPAPVAAISPATASICNGGSATLTASGGGTYAWSNSGNTAAITVSPGSTTTYTVTVTDANTCTATASRIVTVNAPSVAAISPATASICNGGNATLTASGGTGYTWSNSANTISITVSPATTTTYTVTVTNANTCTATASRTVTVAAPPVAAISPGTASICNGGNATLTASGGTGYAWSNSANTISITVSPASTTTYTVTVTDANTCTASVSRTVTVNPAPVPAISPATASICNGASATLTASGGIGYAWSNSANTISITVSPGTTTTYTVTVTDANTCTATASRTVTVNSLPVAGISPAAASICTGASATLTASGGTGYAWSNSANTISITVSPASTTTYTVTVTDANTCTATASRIVTVTAPPVAAISPATTAICNGASTTLTASGGTGYAWSNSANTISITVSPATTTTYTVTVTDANTCTASVSRTVTVNPAPVAAISPATAAICNGTSTTLTASGGTGYTWSNSANTISITVSPATTTTYTVTVIDANTCTATASRTVTVNALPVAAISPATASICNGASATLTASGGTGYAWSNSANTISITVSPVTTTTYTVTVTDANTCTATASRTVTVNSLPVAAISPPNAAICSGASATLTGSGGTGYAWSNSANTISITVSPATTTTYTVTVTDANTCTASVSRTVTVNPASVAAISPATTAICNGTSATLTASGGTGYAWNNSANTISIIVSPATTTTYTVTVTDANTCTATASRTVTVNSLPVAGISPATASICDGGNATLTASGGTGYAWSNSANSISITVSPANTTTYAVTVTDANTCTATASRTVTVNSLPVAAISPATAAICNGGSVTLTASGGTGYTWSNSANTISISVSPSTTTTYTVTVTDANACTASVSRTVTVNSAPVAAISPTTASICNGTSATLTASGGTGYTWSNTANTISITVSPAITTTYSVTVTDANTCTATASRTVTVNALPVAAISPATASICNGASATLTASGGTGYTWSNSANTISITVSPATTTTYDVTVTDVNTCTASASRIVTVNSTPPAAISPATISICASGSATLNASGGTGYAWSNSANTISITVSPASTTLYIVTVTDANTCTATASRTVTVNPVLVATISPATAFACNGGSVTLTASGGANYVWSNSDVTPSITVSPGTTTTYSVTVTDGNTCTATASRTVTIYPLPVASISPAASSVCEGTSATHTASGGTGYAWSNSANTAAITVSPTSTTPYTVTVTDANTCTATVSTTVTVNALPVAAISPATSAICNGQNATLTASGGGAYAWSNSANSSSITVSPAATTTYTVTITDANTCSATASRIVTVNALPIAAISPATSSICIGANATLTASGGGSYAWSNSANTAAVTVSPLTTTSYDVTVTDVNTCTATASRTVTVNSLPLAAISSSTTVLCNSGSATLTASGGTSYAWSNSANTPSITVTPATTTTYTVTVTDANTCSATASETVTVIPVMLLSAAVTNVSCNGGGDGAIDITVSGGQSPYIFLWNNNATSQNLSAIQAGNYSLTVTDDAGCIASVAASVSQPVVLSVSETHDNVLCNGANTGSINISAAGGTSPLSFIWNDGISTEDRNSIVAGNYSLTVSDNNLCSASIAVTLTEPAALVVSETHVDVACGGVSLGSITISNSGGVSPYSYLWNDGIVTQNRTNLSAGNYSVTVQDLNSCSAVLVIPIAMQTGLSVSETHTNVLCNGGSTGTISISANGGTLPHSFIWNDGNTSANRTALAIGTYSVTANDAGTCSASLSVNISEPPAFSVSAIRNNVICNGGSSGSIVISSSGGSSPYSYLWDDGTTSQNRSFVSAGTYSLTVTDNNACSFSLSTQVSQPNAISVIETHTDVLCSGGGSGSINLTVNGGTAPYTCVWNDGNTSQNRSSLSGGNYSVTITDNNTCSVSLSVTVSEPTALDVTESHIDVLCNGASTASIDIIVSGGSPGYSFIWNDGSNLQNRINLSAGNYLVTVNDNNACSSALNISIMQPSAISVSENHVNVLCNGTSTGSINIVTANGVSPYVYTWSDSNSSATRTGLAAGNYSVTVDDNNSCSASLSVVITQPTPLNISESHIDVMCNGGTGSIDITSVGGTPSYTYVWNDGIATEDRNSLAVGNYDVTVNDNNACSSSLSIAISSSSGIVFTETHTDVSCFGGTDGDITVTVNGGSPPYIYLWNDGTATPNRTNIASGLYTLSVTDNNACVQILNVNIVQPTALSVVDVSADVLCNGGNTGSISLTATGGVAPYSFIWNDGNASANRPNLLAGSYSVTTSDNQSCSSVLNINLTEPAAIVLSETHVDAGCNGSNTGSITLTVSGGISPYVYNWNDGTATKDRSNISAGTYTVTLADNNLCSASASIDIIQPPLLVVSESHVNILCNGDNNGSIDILVSGGSLPYTYLWSDASAVEDRSNIAAGSYQVTVSDNSLCSASISVTISEPSALSIAEVHINQTCSGYTDASINTTVSGGTPGYSYSWNDGETTQNRTNLATGTYAITATDNNQCTISSSITITEPVGMTVTPLVNNPSCPMNGNDGNISLNVSGSTSPYQYQWSNGASSASISNLGPASYSATVTDANGCSATAQNSFVLSYQYDFSVEATPAVTINMGDATQLGFTITGNAGNFISLWSPAYGLSCVDCQAPFASPTITTTYSIQIENNLGCKASATTKVTVVSNHDIFIPNAITPNGDGNNDFFQIFGNLKAVQFLDLQIFNRWGEKMFQSNDHHFAWDGTYRGEKQDPQVFIWQLRLVWNDGQREDLRKGSLTLIK